MKGKLTMPEIDEIQQEQLGLSRKHLAKKKFTKVEKRDNSLDRFDPSKIVSALEKAGDATKEYNHEVAEKLAQRVVDILNRQFDFGLRVTIMLMAIVATLHFPTSSISALN